MTAHDKFVAGWWLDTVLDSVPYWLPTVLLVAAVVGVWRHRRTRFQRTAADAARAPLRKRVKPLIDTRPGTNQEALATCNAIWYATVTREQR